MMLVWTALRGGFDEVPDLAARLEESKQLSDRLRSTVVKTADQAHYWYKLWLGMGTEFARSQDLLVGEIDRLRAKAGEHDGKSYLDSMLQKSFRESWATPCKHPANRRVAEGSPTEILVPPKDAKELLEGLT